MLESANYPETKCIFDPEFMLDCCNLTDLFSSRATSTRPGHPDTMEGVAKGTEAGYGLLEQRIYFEIETHSEP